MSEKPLPSMGCEVQYAPCSICGAHETPPACEHLRAPSPEEEERIANILWGSATTASEIMLLGMPAAMLEDITEQPEDKKP